jgi:hypothetical protein
VVTPWTELWAGIPSRRITFQAAGFELSLGDVVIDVRLMVRQFVGGQRAGLDVGGEDFLDPAVRTRMRVGVRRRSQSATDFLGLCA